MRNEIYTYYDLKQYTQLPYSNNKTRVLAYRIETDNMTQYFLRTIDSRIVNPNAYTAYELSNGGEVFIKVEKNVYDKYHDIINGKSRSSVRSLERLVS